MPFNCTISFESYIADMRVQNLKAESATQEKCNMKILQSENGATQEKCNMKRVQSWKEYNSWKRFNLLQRWNMKKV